VNGTLEAVTIRRPDDWHTHLRDGQVMRSVLPYTARVFARAIVMPNLAPPITTPELADGYRERIQAALPSGSGFEPLLTCYLTDDSQPDEVARGHRAGSFFAAKLYPAGSTTNSQLGVTSIDRINTVLTRMEEIGMPLLVHGEVNDPDVDVFDREAVFLDQTLSVLLGRFPTLKVVLEHITTTEAVQFVLAQKGRLGATVTPHHLLINRNSIFSGGIQPHLYCLPVAKRERHRQALRKAVTSGSPHFFLGTDSAPHAITSKESGRAPAGIFNSVTAVECYAQVFDEEGALSRLEAFTSLNGPRFYGLPPNESTITLERRSHLVPSKVAAGTEAIRPFMAGEQLSWSLAI
jgi:dihydroorotase